MFVLSCLINIKQISIMYQDSNLVKWHRYLNFDIIHCCFIRNMYNIIILCGLHNLFVFPVELLASYLISKIYILPVTNLIGSNIQSAIPSIE